MIDPGSKICLLQFTSQNTNKLNLLLKLLSKNLVSQNKMKIDFQNIDRK